MMIRVKRAYESTSHADGKRFLVIAAARHGTVTLVYAAHDVEDNNAVALRDYLERLLR